MCGILGFTGSPDKKLLVGMSKRLRHRGPDAWNSYEDRRVSLGCHRLRIKDPLPRGDQPLGDDEGRQIVFNGEIYNDQELKDELVALGKRFVTETDTEVILHAYAVWGRECFSRFDGMFAVAIWDAPTGRLILARDRTGIKPLLYTLFQGELYFASELKALLAIPDFSRKVDIDAMAVSLMFGCNPLSQSLMTAVYRLPPACTLTFDLASKARKLPDPVRYCDRVTIDGFPAPLSVRSLIASLSSAVSSATRDLDSPSLFLSGGIDSSIILSLLSNREHSARPPLKVRTYTASFEEFDESVEAQSIADHFGTEHTTIEVGEKDLYRLPEVVWHADGALWDQTNVPVFLLSERASRDNKVVLTGDGADELFYGYEQFSFLHLHERVLAKRSSLSRKALGSALGKTPYPLLNKVFPYARQLGEAGMARAKQFVTEPDPLKRYLALVSFFDETDLRGLLSVESQEFSPDVLGMPSVSRYPTPVDYFAQLDRTIFLEPNMLSKADRMSMAHGLETRPPYLSNSLVSMADSVPLTQKLGLFEKKILLRQTAGELLSKKIMPTKKQRFFVPMQTWFNTHSRSLGRIVLDGENFPGAHFFKKSYIRGMWDKFNSSPLYYSRQMWNLVCFSLWYGQYIEDDGGKPINPFR